MNWTPAPSLARNRTEIRFPDGQGQFQGWSGSPAKLGQSGHCWHLLTATHTGKPAPSSPIPWKCKLLSVFLSKFQYRHFMKSPYNFIPLLQVSSSGAKATDRWNLTCGRYTSGRRSRCSPPTSWSSCLCCCSPGGAIIRNSCSQIEIVEILPHSRLWAERQHWRHCGRARAEFSSTRSCWSPTAWPTCPRCSSPASYPLCPDRHPENEQFAIEFPPNISITSIKPSLCLSERQRDRSMLQWRTLQVT